MRYPLGIVLAAFLVGCGRDGNKPPVAATEPASQEQPAASAKQQPVAGKRQTYEERIAALRHAVEKGRVSEVKTLLKSADANDKDDDGQTPLMWAAAKGQTAVFVLLWSQGALANERDSQGRTALMLAAAGNHPRIIDLLLTPDQALKASGAILQEIGLGG